MEDTSYDTVILVSDGWGHTPVAGLCVRCCSFKGPGCALPQKSTSTAPFGASQLLLNALPRVRLCLFSSPLCAALLSPGSPTRPGSVLQVGEGTSFARC